MTTPTLHTELRACARGLYFAEAGVELLIHHDCWLHRSDFTDRFVHRGTSITDGAQLAEIDWTAAITALQTGGLPCSSGESRILRLTASLTDGLPVSLRDTITGLDEHNIKLLIGAVLHASGRPSPGNPLIVS